MSGEKPLSREESLWLHVWEVTKRLVETRANDRNDRRMMYEFVDTVEWFAAQNGVYLKLEPSDVVAVIPIGKLEKPELLEEVKIYLKTGLVITVSRYYVSVYLDIPGE